MIPKDTITHIHLKKVDNHIEIFMVNSQVKEEERVSFTPDEIKPQEELSPALIHLRSDYNEFLAEAGLIESHLTQNLGDISIIVLTESIYSLTEQCQEVFLRLRKAEIGTKEHV